MNVHFFQRFLPQRRQWRLVAVIPLTVVGLVIASFRLPQIQQMAAVTLGNSSQSHAVEDSHAHEAKAADPHGHEDEGKDADGHNTVVCDHDKNTADAHGPEKPSCEESGHSDGHSETEAADAKHDEVPNVKLSTAAQENIGLRLAKIELRPFDRTITVPGIIVERPGRTTTQVAAPLTGVITRVWPMQGETITPGQPLFDLRLTHEEVVESQAEFLRIAEELDVVQREITRLEQATADGVIAGKRMLERMYEQQKLQAAQRSQQQKLLLHGLTPQQVDGILSSRTLLSSITISAPAQDDQATANATAKDEGQRLLQVQELKIEKGQHVRAGDPLCVLADHSRLFVQGKAFEQDASVLDKAIANNWRVSVVSNTSGQGRQIVPELSLLYVANKVETDTRAFLFYVQLSNTVVRNNQTDDGHRFSAWQFKPGQRVDILVPIERWTDRIVLPVNAVVQDGPETYVFEKNNGQFDRRTVRVEYRDQYSAVIANDGALTPGKMVITSGSYQVHLAMKNKAGGAPDPHAGHNH